MTSVTHLSQDEAKRAAIEAGREALREEGRAQWKPYVAGAISAAVKEATAPLKDQFDASVTELRAFHAQHTKVERAAGFWRGFGIGGVLMAALACLVTWTVAKDAQLTNAAARGIEQRGGPEIPTLTIRDQDDTNDRDAGYARRNEPASAR
jgi:hypothetical protein